MRKGEKVAEAGKLKALAPTLLIKTKTAIT